MAILPRGAGSPLFLAPFDRLNGKRILVTGDFTGFLSVEVWQTSRDFTDTLGSVPIDRQRFRDATKLTIQTNKMPPSANHYRIAFLRGSASLAIWTVKPNAPRSV